MFGKAINSLGEIRKQYMYELRKEAGKNERRRQVRGMKGTGTRWMENMVEQKGKKQQQPQEVRKNKDSQNIVPQTKLDRYKKANQ